MAKICERTAHRTVWAGGSCRAYSGKKKESFGYNDWDIYHGA